MVSNLHVIHMIVFAHCSRLDELLPFAVFRILLLPPRTLPGHCAAVNACPASKACPLAIFQQALGLQDLACAFMVWGNSRNIWGFEVLRRLFEE